MKLSKGCNKKMQKQKIKKRTGGRFGILPSASKTKRTNKSHEGAVRKNESDSSLPIPPLPEPQPEIHGVAQQRLNVMHKNPNLNQQQQQQPLMDQPEFPLNTAGSNESQLWDNVLSPAAQAQAQQIQAQHVHGQAREQFRTMPSMNNQQTMTYTKANEHLHRSSVETDGIRGKGAANYTINYDTNVPDPSPRITSDLNHGANGNMRTNTKMNSHHQHNNMSQSQNYNHNQFHALGGHAHIMNDGTYRYQQSHHSQAPIDFNFDFDFNQRTRAAQEPAKMRKQHAYISKRELDLYAKFFEREVSEKDPSPKHSVSTQIPHFHTMQDRNRRESNESMNFSGQSFAFLRGRRGGGDTSQKSVEKIVSNENSNSFAQTFSSHYSTMRHQLTLDDKTKRKNAASPVRDLETVVAVAGLLAVSRTEIPTLNESDVTYERGVEHIPNDNETIHGKNIGTENEVSERGVDASKQSSADSVTHCNPTHSKQDESSAESRVEITSPPITIGEQSVHIDNIHHAHHTIDTPLEEPCAQNSSMSISCRQQEEIASIDTHQQDESPAGSSVAVAGLLAVSRIKIPTLNKSDVTYERGVEHIPNDNETVHGKNISTEDEHLELGVDASKQSSVVCCNPTHSKQDESSAESRVEITSPPITIGEQSVHSNDIHHAHHPIDTPLEEPCAQNWSMSTSCGQQEEITSIDTRQQDASRAGSSVEAISPEATVDEQSVHSNGAAHAHRAIEKLLGELCAHNSSMSTSFGQEEVIASIGTHKQKESSTESCVVISSPPIGVDEQSVHNHDLHHGHHIVGKPLDEQCQQNLPMSTSYGQQELIIKIVPYGLNAISLSAASVHGASSAVHIIQHKDEAIKKSHHQDANLLHSISSSETVDVENALRSLYDETSGALPSKEKRRHIFDQYNISQEEMKVWFIHNRAKELSNKKMGQTRKRLRAAKDDNCRVVGHNLDLIKKEKGSTGKILFLGESHSVLREAIKWALEPIKEDGNQILYPNAPLAELWVKDLQDKTNNLPRIMNWNLGGKHSLTMKHSLLGRRWLWDEGHFTDGLCYTSAGNAETEGKQDTPIGFIPVNLRAHCNCGQKHPPRIGDLNCQTPSRQDRGTRRSTRVGTSVKISSVLTELASGSLNPHTLISCDEYTAGPEFRYLISSENDEHKKEFLKRKVESTRLLQKIGSSLKLDDSKIQPFDVKISPDVSFITDLHCHLSNSEVIGLLGGDYDETEKRLHIQAAFPCKSTERPDDGFTDVEMDSVSQLTAIQAISRQGMKVVGWYHSHPQFQPDPSVTDIDNQNLYQSNFGKDNCPFVGLIVGTYDAANPSPQSVMRWFHLAAKQSDAISYSHRKKRAVSTQSHDVQYPMKLQVTYRNARKYYSDSELSEIVEKKKELAKNGSKTRFVSDMAALSSSLKDMSKKSVFDSLPKLLCGFISKDSNSSKVITDLTPISEESSKTDSKIIVDGPIPGEGMNYTTGHTGVHQDLHTESNPPLALEILHGELGNEGCAPAKKHYSSAHDRNALAYTRQEYEILTDGTISNDIRASVVWHAVVREQILDKDLQCTKRVPTSSTILERLYDSTYFGDEVSSFLITKHFLADDDAVIVHGVDAMFNHYMNDSNKIDVFKCSDFSVDASSIDTTSLSYSSRQYYKSIIAEDTSSTFKLRIGQKIASSLLTWVSHMHLNSHRRIHEPDPIDKLLGASACGLNSDIEFLSDVMRLLAAKWREASEWNGIKIEIARQPQKPERSRKDHSKNPSSPNKRGLKRRLGQGKSSRKKKQLND